MAARFARTDSSIFSSRYILVGAAVLIYAVILAIALARDISGAISALAILPVLVGGWLLGLRGGFVTAIITLIFSFLIFLWLDDVMTLVRGGTFGNILVIVLGTASGWLSELVTKVRQQAIELQHEIEEREKAEQARRESEARLRTVVENAPLLLWSVDKAGKVTVLEGQVLETLKFTAADIIGQAGSALYRGIPGLEEDMQQALEGNAVNVNRKVDGLSLDAHIIPLKAADGTVLAVIGVATDITEQQKTKAALGEAQSDLESKNQQLARVNEYFRSTLDQLLETANRGGDMDEIGAYLKQVETEFKRLA